MTSDAQRLLLQIQSLLGLAAVTVASSGCDTPSASNARADHVNAPSSKGVVLGDHGELAKHRPELQGQGGRTPGMDASGNSGQKTAPKPSKSTVASKLPPAPIPGYRLGDPPLVEGWDPEEATCVSGNWCGPMAAAAKVVRIGMEDELDPESRCPTHLMGKRENGVDPKKKVYRGLSSDRMMRGTLQPWRTQRTREQRGKEDFCCYHWFDYCAGRPLDEGARTQQGRREMAAQCGGDLCDAQALQLARAYWADADDEYDSVAAFARCTLELFALGAPDELVEASQRASLDELRHARACQTLSKRYHPHDWPTRAPAEVNVRKVDLETFLASTFRDGCVGETVASLRVARMAAKSKDPKVRKVLEEISKEEAEHAALAWKIVAWGLRVGGEACKQGLLVQAASLQAELLAGLGPDADGAGEPGERLSPRELRDCAGDAWRGVVLPILDGMGCSL